MQNEDSTPPPLLYEESNGDRLDDDYEDCGSSSSDDMDAEEDSNAGEPTTCLFCAKVAPSVEAALDHLDGEHQISLQKLKQKFHMDQYAFIKLINCIRSEKVTADKLLQAQEPFWNDDKYLKPLQYEPWLSYDFEDMPSEASQTAGNVDALQAKEQVIVELRRQIAQQQNLLKLAHEDIAKMREGFQRLLAVKDSNDSQENKKKKPHCVSSKSLTADEGYFGSYAHFGIHHEMLSDVVRTTSYRDALLLNKSFVMGKDVLDVGCGTAVLSMFASQAGAQAVVAIDNSDIIYEAMDIVKKNNIDNVTLVKGRLEDTELPIKAYDIIISEWMGYFLLFEGMLDTVIYARDNLLKEDGIILPNRCTMSLLGYGDDSLYQKHVNFWDNVYGLDMSNMKKEVLHEPLITIVDAQWALTKAQIISDLNISKVNLNYSNFSFNFELECVKAGQLSSFVGYFDTYFDLPQSVMFGTAPTDKPTHWKQVVFFLEKPQKVKEGEVVPGKITCRRSRVDARSLDISIEAFGLKHTYHLD